MTAQRLTALAFFVMSAGYGAIALGIEGVGGLSSSRMGPSTFPVVLSIFGLGISLSLLLRPGGQTESGSQDRRRAAILVGLTLMYAAGLAALGFVPSTVVFLATAQYTLGERRGAVLLGVPLAMALSSTVVLRLLTGNWLPEPVLRAMGVGS